MHVKVKKLNENAVIPTRGSVDAAGYDLYANWAQGDGDSGGEPGTETIGPHKTVKFGTGVAMEIPSGCFGAVFARSGLATKQGLRPSNCVGVIDADYRGEIIVALHNDTDEPQTVKFGDRIAQLVIMPFYGVLFDVVEELEETDRGTGGFGSTGKQ